MITFIRGIVSEKAPTRVVMDLNGIGYEVLIPLSSYDMLPQKGETCTLLTHDHIREDLHILFGFSTETERKMFLMLLGVNGIGPKLALSALSGMTVRDLQAAILEGNSKRLSNIQGVGKKTAERMVVELRDKISTADALQISSGDHFSPDTPGSVNFSDAMAALTSLGYSNEKSRKMVEKVIQSSNPPTSVENIIKQALSGR